MNEQEQRAMTNPNEEKQSEIIKSIVTENYEGDPAAHTRNFNEVYNDFEASVKQLPLSLELDYILPNKMPDSFNLPNECVFTCSTDFGGSEGIYIDIICRSEDWSAKFATIKTLEDTVDAFMAMNELAGKCQLILNGNGREYQLTSNKPKRDFNLSLDNAQKIVYVCSPLRGEIQSNIERARTFGRYVAEQGATPIAPHVTEFFDDTIPEQREQGLNLGINYLERSDELWVFGNQISSGMAEEIRIAKENMTIPIYHVDDRTFERIPFDEWQKHQAIRGSEESDLPLHRDLSDRIKEYEEDFDLSPAATENMTIEEMSAYCRELEISMHHNSLEHEYDEPFSPDITFTQRGEILYLSDGTEINTITDKLGDCYSAKGNEYYPVVTHNSITNETRMIGFDKGRSYEFSIDEYTAFKQMESDASNRNAYSRINNDNNIDHTENTEMRRTKQARANKAPRKSEFVTAAQIEMADKVDLKSYLETHGYTLKAHGRDYKLLLEGHDSTVIFPDTNTWYSFSNDKGGGTIKFLTELERKDFVSAVKELIGEARDFSIIHSPNQVSEPKPRQPMTLPEHDENNNRVFAYLIKTRGIDREIVAQCVENNSIYQGKNTITKGNEKFTFSNCIFVGFDENHSPKYASQRSLNDMNGAKVFKQDVLNSDKEYAFVFMGKDNAEWVSVCEAPIDVLSKATLNKLNNDIGNEHIISLGGVSDKALDKFLEINTNIKVINICLDNDEAGRKAGAKIADKYIKLGYQVVESYPKAKDYNEELIRVRRELEQKVELPVASADNSIIIKHLTANKMLSPAVVDDLVKNELMYQRERITAKGTAMHDVVFVSKDHNKNSIYGITVNYNDDPDRIDFKMEHRGTTSHNYLSHIGDSSTLRVFNNPISMYTYITICQAKGKPCDNCICSISKQHEAVCDFISIHTDIKSIKISMDKAVSNTPNGQPFDIRENEVNKITKAVGSKIAVSKQYPKSNSLSQDWISQSQSQKNPQHNNHHSASAKPDMQLEP